MEVFEGKSIFPGTVIGKIYYYVKEEKQVEKIYIADVTEEIDRFERARAVAREQLSTLHQKAMADVGEEGAMIFEVHGMLLEDEEFVASVKKRITDEAVNAEYAVKTVGEQFATVFAQMKDEYFQARAVDIQDISGRIVRVLQKSNNELAELKEPVIVVASNLVPSETIMFDKKKLLSFVTQYGTSNSHTAILARTLNIPSLISVDIKEDWNQKRAIVDGNEGKIIIEPTEEVLHHYEEIMKKEEEYKQLLKNFKGKSSITRDGKQISIYANIGNVTDVEEALENDAEGIGLFRSEFLYLERGDYPTEEEQFQIYKTVAQKMTDKKVIIRTLDIGADKQVPYFNLEREENPAMGYRGVRICLDRIQLFKTQLRALYRASVFGNISIMFPMIISLKEVLKIKEICNEVKNELQAEGIAVKEIELGIMIETPAAVMISDLLSKEVDFFSIGTNDLTQYTLAIDRQNPKLDMFYDAHHEGILRMIQMVVRNGHEGGCWVGICGELAADTSLTEQFIQMGIDELSVSAPFVLPVRRAVCQANAK